jgi:hypothetical protein
MANEPLLPPTSGLCPYCGYDRFTAGRAITIWQTLSIHFLPDGTWDHDGQDELHDTLDTEPFDPTMTCDDCGRDVRFPQETPAP